MVKEGRGPAGYYLRARTRNSQAALLEEEFVPLELVNTIRGQMKSWRERGYPGMTPITRQLLNTGTAGIANAGSSSRGRPPKRSSGWWRPPRRRKRGYAIS